MRRFQALAKLTIAPTLSHALTYDRFVGKPRGRCTGGGAGTGAGAGAVGGAGARKEPSFELPSVGVLSASGDGEGWRGSSGNTLDGALAVCCLVSQGKMGLTLLGSGLCDPRLSNTRSRRS